MIIVGAGIVGASFAYHAYQNGVDKITVLSSYLPGDRNQATSNTWGWVNGYASNDKSYATFRLANLNYWPKLINNISNLLYSKRLEGASTITQQVAKNFLLSNEVSLDRKIKEAILAFRIERALSKERILELYLNQIYLGEGSYGIASASLRYFDKPINELNFSDDLYCQ